jgi:hypothetical protein
MRLELEGNEVYYTEKKIAPYLRPKIYGAKQNTMSIVPFKPLKLKPNTKEYSDAPSRNALQTKASQDKTPAEGSRRIRADRPDRKPADILSEGHAAKTNRVGREKRKSQKAERNLKRTLFAQAKFTKAVVDDLFHGIKKPQGVRPANLKKNIQAAYQGKTIRLNKLRIKDIVAHMKGEKTLYVSAPWRIKAEYLLVIFRNPNNSAQPRAHGNTPSGLTPYSQAAYLNPPLTAKAFTGISSSKGMAWGTT